MRSLAQILLVGLNGGITPAGEVGKLAECQLSICVDYGHLKPSDMNRVGFAKQQTSKIFHHG